MEAFPIAGFWAQISGCMHPSRRAHEVHGVLSVVAEALRWLLRAPELVCCIWPASTCGPKQQQ